MKKYNRILIVDDVVDNIRVAMNILKEDNYDLSFAHDGADALRLVGEDPQHFDLILLDIMMPGINGFEVCQKFKENAATQPCPMTHEPERCAVFPL
jgi:putative two-component system response regulator